MERFQGYTGPLHGFPGGLQEQPLLRVHRQRLAWRDPEERRVEPTDVVQEPPFHGERGPCGVRGLAEAFPAPVQRECGYGVDARGGQLPQVLGAAHTARVPAAHADDRDGLRVSSFDLLKTLTGLVQIRGDPLEVFPQRLFVRHSIPP